jgi:hypothetical protein
MLPVIRDRYTGALIGLDHMPQVSRRAFGGLAGGGAVTAVAGTSMAAVTDSEPAERLFKARPAASASNRPSILVILGDDVGWVDLSGCGDPHIKTPCCTSRHPLPGDAEFAKDHMRNRVVSIPDTSVLWNAEGASTAALPGGNGHAVDDVRHVWRRGWSGRGDRGVLRAHRDLAGRPTSCPV